MAKFNSQPTPIPYEVQNAAQNTGVETERVAGDNTLRLNAGGVNDIAKITSSLVNFNDDQNDVSLAFHSEDTRNLLYIKGTTGDDGVGFGTSNTQFTTTEGFRRSRSLYIKPDALSYNNIAIGIYSNDALRGTDFGSIRARGTEDVPLVLQNSDWLHQYTIYGHDGVAFRPAAGFRYEVADTPSAGVMPTLVKFLTSDSAGALATRFTINKDLAGFGSGIINPNSGLQINHSLALKVQNTVPSGYNTSHDTILGVVTNSTPITVNIPTTERVTGRILVIVDRSGNAATNNITIDPESTTTINGKSTYVIKQNYGFVILYCGGSNWFIMGESARGTFEDVTVHNAATLTLTNTNHIVIENYTTTGAVTMTLPAASTMWDSVNSRGKTLIIKDGGCNASANNITINRAGSDTIITNIAADTSAVINGNGDSLTLKAISSTQYAVV